MMRYRLGLLLPVNILCSASDGAGGGRGYD